MLRPARLLYIGSDETERAVLFGLVRRKDLPWDVTCVRTLGDARARLAASHFDAIVAESRLPDGETTDLFDEVPDTPFVLLTSSLEEPFALRTLERGADDYLPKDPERRHLESLPLAVEKTLHRKRLRQKEQELARQLRQSEQRLRATFENAASGVIQTDGQDRLVAVNDRLCQMLGYTREQLLGMSVHELTWPEDRPRSDDLNAQLHEGRLSVLQYEKRYLRGDGSPLWVQVGVSAVRDEAGLYLYSVGTVVDISARKAAEAQVRLQAAALAAAPNAISLSMTDREGTIVWVNPAFTALTGYSPEDVIGRSHQILSSGRQDEGFYRDLWETIGRGEVWRGELVNRRKDGTLYEEEMAITPLRDEAGHITHYVAIKQDITERKRAEEALRLSESKFRSVFQQAAIGMGRVRFSDARWIDVNEAFCRMLGYSAEEMLATPWPRITHPEDVDLDLVSFRRMAAGELDSYTVEKRFLHKQGHHVWARLTLSLVRDAQGRPDYEIAIIEDVSQRRQAEAALRESEQRFRGTFENAAVGITHVDADGRWLRVNERFRRLLGRPCDELRGRSLLDFTYPDDREPDTSQYAALWRGEMDSYAVEKRYIRGDGQVIWTLVTRSLQRDERGRPLYAISIVQDINDLKQAEESLRRSEERFRTLADNMSQFAWMADEKGWIFWYNKRWYDYTGTTLEQVQGWGWRQVHHPDHVHRVVDKISRCFATGEVWEDTFPLRGRDGRYRWFLSRAVPIRDEAGNVVRWFGTHTDITERLEAERHLRELNETLEQRVAERTAEADARAEQLRHLAAELARTEQRERKRLAQVLHDHLQQLLVGARFSTSILRGRIAADEEALQYLANVDDLLDQSIQASRSLTVELSPPILSEGLVPALRWLAGWMREKHGLRVDVAADEPLGPVDEDTRTLLFQSVRELLFNVVKHAGVGEARVTLDRSCAEQLRVVVEDRGVGFEPGGDRRHTDAGTGLGLLSIQERLEAMGSRLEIDTATGKGARMTLVAPVAVYRPQPPAALASEEPAAAKSPAAVESPAAPGLAGRGGCIRVLIADDHTVVREGMSRLLQTHADIEVVGTAADGQEAVELTSLLQPDVVLMDVSMPGLNGIEATRQLRRQAGQICIIGLSMHSEEETARRMLEAGAAHYLVKTAPPQQLVATIRACAPGLRTCRS